MHMQTLVGRQLQTAMQLTPQMPLVPRPTEERPPSLFLVRRLAYPPWPHPLPAILLMNKRPSKQMLLYHCQVPVRA